MKSMNPFMFGELGLQKVKRVTGIKCRACGKRVKGGVPYCGWKCYEAYKKFLAKHHVARQGDDIVRRNLGVFDVGDKLEVSIFGQKKLAKIVAKDDIWTEYEFEHDGETVRRRTITKRLNNARPG